MTTNRVRRCPCCDSQFFGSVEKIPEHGVLIPIRVHGLCMASGHTMEDARALVPVYRMFVGWRPNDTLMLNENNARNL